MLTKIKNSCVYISANQKQQNRGVVNQGKIVAWKFCSAEREKIKGGYRKKAMEDNGKV